MWLRLQYKLKAKRYTEHEGVNAAGRWSERNVAYLGRSHGRKSNSSCGVKLAMRSQQTAYYQRITRWEGLNLKWKELLKGNHERQ